MSKLKEELLKTLKNKKELYNDLLLKSCASSFSIYGNSLSFLQGEIDAIEIELAKLTKEKNEN